MMTPKVSVIIPMYNAEPFISESLESILNQSYVNLEILVCDDASTDRSREQLKRISDSRIKFLYNEKNLGYLKTVNKLMQLSTGKYIAFHDADDLSAPDRISLQVEYLLKHPEVALIGTNFKVIDARGIVVHQYGKQLSDPEVLEKQLRHDNPFQKPSIMFDRVVFETIGGFREGFLKLKNISEDYDWLLRASEKFKLSNINGDSPLYAYRAVATAMSKQYDHPEQQFGHGIVQRLAAERRSGLVDAMDRQDWHVIEGWISEMRAPYDRDASLFYYERAESLLYSRLYRGAFKYAIRAWVRSPFKFRNVKCVVATLRHWIF